MRKCISSRKKREYLESTKTLALSQCWASTVTTYQTQLFFSFLRECACWLRSAFFVVILVVSRLPLDCHRVVSCLFTVACRRFPAMAVNGCSPFRHLPNILGLLCPPCHCTCPLPVSALRVYMSVGRLATHVVVVPRTNSAALRGDFPPKNKKKKNSRQNRNWKWFAKSCRKHSLSDPGPRE
jgi:hypothetical protein